MQVTRKSRIYIRIQNILFVVLFIAAVGLLAWLSNRYSVVADWTLSGRNTLSEVSISVLETLDGPVNVTAFVRGGGESDVVRSRIQDIIGRYQRHKNDIHLAFINPDLEPQQVRELGISVEGELVVRYGERSENLQDLTEQQFTNVLQRLARSRQNWIVFLEGHGERDPHGQANHDLGMFIRQVENKGFRVQTINLATTRNIPDNTAVLVIASPRAALLDGEVRLITDYLKRGGNLLWLQDPGELQGLSPLAELLGIEFHPGVIVDPNTRVLNIQDPRFALVASYGSHSITLNFNLLTLFPIAGGIDLQLPEGWSGEGFLLSTAQSWSETGDLSGSIRLDEGSDIPGPLNIGVALTRVTPAAAAETGADSDATPAADGAHADSEKRAAEQRVVVLGDGDFVSNTYLGNAGNMDLGLRIFNWLVRDDDFINIPAKVIPGRALELTPASSAVIGLGFLFVLPLLLIAAGTVIWWRRRKR